MSQHRTKHRPRSATAAGDVLTRAGLEGLLASIPTAVMLTVKETVATNLRSTLSSVVAKGENAASQAMTNGIAKFKINAPIVVAALIIGGAVVHGAWVGKRKHEARSFAEREEARRGNQMSAGEGINA